MGDASATKGRRRLIFRPPFVIAPLLAAGALGAACGGKAENDGSQSPSGAPDATGGSSESGEPDGSGSSSSTADPSTLTFSRIVAGRDHFCGITQTDRRLVCVAGDQVVVEEPGPFIALDMNDDNPPWEYRCAVKESGELTCSGSPNLPVPSGEFVEVSVGFFNACARRVNAELECWLPESLGGLTSVESASQGYSVDLWSICSQNSMLDAACFGRDGTALLPGDGSGHLLGGYFTSVRAAPEAGCAAIFVAIPDQQYEEFGEVLNKNNIACFSGGEARSKIDGVFSAFDVNVNEDGCALHSDAGSQPQVACWGDFEGSVPVDVFGPFTQVSVSSGLACVLHETGSVRCWPPRT